MPHAIIRGKNGRRHEVDFGDAPIRVEIYASDETVEIFVDADFETHAEERRRFAILNIPRNLFSEASGAATRRSSTTASETGRNADGHRVVGLANIGQGKPSCLHRADPAFRTPPQLNSAPEASWGDLDIDIPSPTISNPMSAFGPNQVARLILNRRPARHVCSVSTGSIHRSTRMRSAGWGAEKSGVGAVSIRRRQAVVPSAGLGPGDLRKPSPSR